MAKEKKIQDYDWCYNVLRYYVDFVLKLSYRNVRYVGTENIPQNGAVIYAPNHTNALMDALVILAMDRKPKVFVARADIFKNKTAAKLFRFLKIMPIMRMRDGIDEVRKNDETISKAVDVLQDRVPLCIFPEGTHQAKYSALPLSKGIFRIAFQAQEMMKDMPLWIVPVGLRYGSFFRFRSTVRVQIGDPINVREFIEEHSDYPQQVQINLAKDMLTERMKQSMFYIPDDENYAAMYEICAATVMKQSRMVKRHPENATKHNIVSPERPLTIFVCAEGDTLTVRNNIQPRITAQASTGTGLKNIRQQYLDICNRPISVEKTQSEFIVNIPLL